MIEVRMELKRETKNTYRYDAKPISHPAVTAVTAVYVDKAAFNGNPPLTIRLKIEEEQ